jgi:hypothetical protein
LESAYEACLSFELAQRGLKVEQQKPLPVVYREVKLDCGYRLDLRVEEAVIVEVKAADRLMQIQQAADDLWSARMGSHHGGKDTALPATRLGETAKPILTKLFIADVDGVVREEPRLSRLYAQHDVKALGICGTATSVVHSALSPAGVVGTETISGVS